MAKNNIVFSMILNNTDFVKKMNLSWKETQHLERIANKTEGTLKQMVMGGLTPMIGKLSAFAGGAALVGGALSRSMEKMMALDTALAEMKALTGATAEQMERFKTAAIGMSSSTTVAADEIIRAMIKVGGAMPQLLGFEQGLKNVTQSAITLSEASGMGLDDSINSLTGIMNQFGASAMDSDRYINALAAASQAGSAEIDYLAEAVAKSGGAATSAGIEFEELLSLIEAVAPKFGKAEEAGTALRGVLLKMETGGEKTKISTQGLAKALDELAKMNSDEMLKKFGVEGYNMAKAMVDARDSFAKFNTEVRDTNSAYEQAEIRANNLRGAIDQLANKWDSITLSINQSNGPLTKFVNLLGDALDGVDMLLPNYDKWAKNQDQLAQSTGMKEAAKIVESKKASGMTEKAAVKEALGESNAKLAKMRQTEEWMKKLAPEKIATPKSGADDSWFGDVADYILSATPAGMGKQLVDFLEHRKGELNKMDHESPLTLLQREIKAEEAKSAALSDKLNALKEKPKPKPKPKGKEPNPTVESADPEKTIIAGLDVTDLTAKKEKIRELETEIAQLEDLLMLDPSRTDIISTLDRLKEQLQQIKPEIAEVAEKSNVAVQEIEPTYTNPWEQKYQDNWQNGNSFQRVDFAADAAGTVANGMNSVGNLVGKIPGLEETGSAINEATSVITDVMGVIQGVSAVIQLVNGVGLASNTAVMGLNTSALTANTVALTKMAMANASEEIGSLSLSDDIMPKGFFGKLLGLPLPFANGGIVGGSSFTGDKLLARVNSGEAILNREQQKRALAQMGSTVISPKITGGETIVKGEDIYVALKNYQTSTGNKL